MSSRNFLLGRSIAFGALTKVVGSLVVLVGLPIISHHLTASDYATFLHGMSAASLLTLWLGATVALAVRGLAHAIASGNQAASTAAERDSIGLFLLTMGLSVLITVPVVLISMPPRVDMVLLAVGMSAVGGMLLWGDAYRVALRSDHISSMWQLLATVTMLVLLILFSGKGLLAVVLIYFGTPVAAQIAVLLHLRQERSYSLIPTFGLTDLKGHLVQGAPILLNSVAEYGKIFGSALVFAQFTTVESYARFATIVLLIARLANPLSLITRPLMPAYIDAVRSADLEWLRFAARCVVIVAAGGAVAGVIVAAVLPTTWLGWLLPPALGQFTRGELVLCAMFLWGHGMGGLMTPLYVARHKQWDVARVNMILVALGIAGGSFAALAGFSDSMLPSMALSTGAAGAILSWKAVRRLFTLSEPPEEREEDLLAATAA